MCYCISIPDVGFQETTVKIFNSARSDKNDIITDAKYDVMGCIGAVSAAMAIVDLIKGKATAHAKTIGDSDVFHILKEIPEEKHHCIQLAVKTLHKALEEYGKKNAVNP